jgi:ADP-heptose:LPS heptosyltransferase
MPNAPLWSYRSSAHVTSPAMSPRTVLIESSLGIGDAIVLAPMLRCLKRAYPSVRISLLSRRGGYYEHRALRAVDEVIVPRGPVDYVRLLRRRFDLLLMPGHYRSTNGVRNTLLYRALFRLIRARRRITLGDLDAPEYRELSRLDAYLRLLELAGIPTSPQDRCLELPALDLPSPSSIPSTALVELKASGQPTVIVHIGSKAGYHTRDWPERNWRDLLTHLWDHYRMTAVFIGSTDDAERTAALCHMLSSPRLNIVAKLNLESTAAVIRDGELFVSTNSGPMWIAAALQKPQLAFCGPSKPAWDPINPHAIVLRRPVDRRHCTPPCDARTCIYGDTACMNGIDAKEAIAAADRLVAQHLTARSLQSPASRNPA